LTSVGNSGPKFRLSEEPVKKDGKTEGYIGQQYLDKIFLIKYKITLEPNKLDLNELVGGQNEAQWAGVARAGKRGLLNQ
jgi:hypothetical protein